MSTNSNTQQINVFNKGMNTDTSDAYLSHEQYRFAENLRFLTDTGENSGELRLIEGWSERFNFASDKFVTSEEKFGDVIATNTIRQYGLVIGVLTDGRWCIWRIDIITDKVDRIFGPCNDLLGDHVSTVTRWESDSNAKLYIADGKHVLMSINILLTPKEVPTDINYLIGASRGVIPPLSTEINTDLNSILRQSVIQYACKLYLLGGNVIGISPLTIPINLYTEGIDVGDVVNKSINLSLKYTSNANRISVYRIMYTQNGLEPDINLIYDDDYNGKDFSYTDVGLNISQVSSAEFISMSLIDIKPALIESKNDYLFCANIKYNQQDVDSLFEGCTAKYSAETAGSEGRYTMSYDGKILNGNYTPSFRNGETYRFGIVFYDLDGNRSSVMLADDLLIDIKTPQIEVENSSYVFNPIRVRALVRFDDTGFKNCSGWELVRCKRTIYDSRVITQGIVGRTQRDPNHDTNTRYMYPYMSLQRVLNNSYALENGEDHKFDTTYYTNGSFSKQLFETSEDLLMFASPEYAYLKDETQLMLQSLQHNLSICPTKNYSIPIAATYIKDRIVKVNPDYKYRGEDDRVYTVETHSELLYYTDRGNPRVGHMLDNNTRIISPGYVDYPSKAGYTSGAAFVSRNGEFIEYGSTSVHAIKLDGDNNDDVSTRRYVLLACIYPDNEVTCNGGEYVIKNIGFADTPDTRQFGDENGIKIDGDRTVVGNLEYVNWDAIHLYNTGVFKQGLPANTMKEKNEWSFCLNATAGKRCILLNTETNIPDMGTKDGLLPITVANIVNNSVIPYGGNTRTSKLLSTYYSFGDYVSRQNYKAATSTTTTNHGDTYLCVFVYNSAHCWDSSEYIATMNPTVYSVPIESSIDLTKSLGDLYFNIDSPYKYYFLDVPMSINKYTQENYAYVYNTVYNVTPSLVTSSSIDYTQLMNDRFDCRILYSDQKTNGEYIDSWLNFKSANYLDVDTRYGLITNLRLFKDTLVFWLEGATGVLAVNERTLLQDTNNTNIILGNGDVLLRYDYISTEFGMQPNQEADTQSGSALYWWDGNKKEILLYAGGQSAAPMNKAKTISNYINDARQINNPVLAYDSKYNEVLANVVEGGPIVYNEFIQQFTSVYKTPFTNHMKFFDKLLLISNNKVYNWNSHSTNEDDLLYPYLCYIINDNSMYVKVYDNVLFGMGEEFYFNNYSDFVDKSITFKFTTPLKQTSQIDSGITNRECDLRFAIPRNNNQEYGGRMRGRTMRCEMFSDNPSTVFSLQYIITKYRISFS